MEAGVTLGGVREVEREVEREEWMPGLKAQGGGEGGGEGGCAPRWEYPNILLHYQTKKGANLIVFSACTVFAKHALSRVILLVCLP